MAATTIARIEELARLPKAKREVAYDELWLTACEAGEAAVGKTTPTPMVVGTPKDMLGSLMGGDGGGFDTEQPVHFVPSGVCGFAWVTVTPGTSSFARWLKREYGARRGYYGGVEVSAPRATGQSYELKCAWAGAVARALSAAGLSAYMGSRLD